MHAASHESLYRTIFCKPIGSGRNSDNLAQQEALPMRRLGSFLPSESVGGTGVVAYNPTGLVGALAYWAADAIRQRYLKHPGPLVQA